MNRIFENEYEVKEIATEYGFDYIIIAQDYKVVIDAFSDAGTGLQVSFYKYDVYKKDYKLTEKIVMTDDELKMYSLVIINDLGVHGPCDYYAQQFYDRVWEKWEDDILYWINAYCEDTPLDEDIINDKLMDALYANTNSLTGNNFERWLKRL